MVICFSGIGNSKYIADRIAASLQEKLLCMNERIKSGNTGSVKTRVWFLTGSDRQNLSGRRMSGM